MGIFKEYLSKYDLLKENPMRTGNFEPFEFEENNPEMFVMKSNSGYKLIHQQKHTNGITIFFYQRSEPDGSYDLKLIPDNIKEVIGNIIYIQRDGGIEINSVYNQPLFKGMIFKIFFEFLLPKNEYIISGGIHSPRGETFWQRIIDVGLKNGYKCSVININGGEEIVINNIEELLNFYGDEKFEKYRVKIYK